MSWHTLATHAADLAAFGAAHPARPGRPPGHRQTRRRPRLHPVRPIVTTDRLFVFMKPAAPKGHDLRRDGATC
jgi:hypothetical protein